MSSIDERVVQMQFDNAQFERGANQTISTLDRLKASLNFGGASKSLDDFATAANNINLSGFSGAVVSAAKSFNAVYQVAASVINRITNDLITSGSIFVKSLTTDNIDLGFSKYEQETKAVQTILANTDSTIDDTNKLISKLMWFSDETSYSFDGMISNISKFTTAGTDLETASKAIIGIADACGLAGVEAAKSTHAMDGFSKAMGRGYMDTQSWMWIHTAGLDTKTFNDQMIKAGLATGRLVEEMVTVDGVETKVIKTSTDLGKQIEVTGSSIQNSLHTGWMDIPTMLLGLQEYSKFTEKVYEAAQLPENANKSAAELIDLLGAESENTRSLGERALRASQETRTFSDAITSVKDAVSSQWTETFNLVFGDYEEAKQLWGDLNEYLWDMFTASGYARNEALQFWKDQGGREALLKGLYNAASQFQKVLDTVSESWHEVFNVDLGERLLDWSNKIGHFLENLDLTEDKADKLKGVLKGLFTIIKSLLSAIKRIYELFAPVGRLLGKGLSKVFEVFSDVGKIISGDMSSDNVSKTAQVLSTLVEPLNAIKNVVTGGQSITQGLESFKSAMGSIGETVKSFISKLPSLATIKTGSTFAFFGALIYLLSQINWLVETLATKGLIGALLGDFDSIWSPLGALFKSFKAANITRTVLQVAVAFAAIALGVSIMVNAFARLGEMDGSQLITAFISLLGILALIGGFLAVMHNLAKGTMRIATSVILIALGISLMVGAFSKLGTMGDTLGTALIALGGILSIIALFLLIGGIAEKAVRTAFATVLIAVAITSMVWAFSKLGAMGDTLGTALIALGGILSIIVLFLLIGGIAEKAVRTAFATVLIAVAITSMVWAFSKLGTMGDTLGTALIALGGILSIIALFLLIGGIAEKAVRTAFATVLIAVAITSMVWAFSKLGAMGDTLGTALIALGGILSIIVLFLLIGGIAEKAIGSAFAVLLIAAAMDLIAIAFLGFKAVGDSLQSAVAAMLTILVVVALIGQVGGAGILSFAISMLTLSAALVITAAAVMLFSLAINVLAGQSFESIIGAVLGLSVALIALAAAAALIGLFSAPVIAGAMAMAALGIAVAICAGAMWLLSAAIEHSGPLVAALTALWEGLGTTIENAMSKASNSYGGYSFDTDEYGNVVAKKISSDAQEINESADALRDANENVNSAIEDSQALGSEPVNVSTPVEIDPVLVGDSKTNMVNSIGSMLTDSSFVEDLKGKYGNTFVADLFSGVASGDLSGIDPSVLTDILGPSFAGAGTDVSQMFAGGYAEGMSDPAQMQKIEEAATMMEATSVENAQKGVGEAVTAGANLALGYAAGIERNSGAAASAAAAMAGGAVAAINTAQQSGSPSRLTYKSGRWFDEGYANAINEYAYISHRAASSMAQGTVDALGNGLSRMNGIAKGTVQVAPTVRPIMDLRSVQNGSRSLDMMFTRRQAMYANIADQERRNNNDLYRLVDVANSILSAVNSGHALYLDGKRVIGYIDRGLGQL